MRTPLVFAGGPLGSLLVLLLLIATLAAGFAPRLLPVRLHAWPRNAHVLWHPSGHAPPGSPWHGSWTPAPVPHTPPRPLDVVRVIDGDTFDGRLRGTPAGFVRVRLRDIDAAELHARCSGELRRALAARRALAQILAEGGVQISDIGQDKYPERIDAHVATRRTPDVSAALLRMGLVRPYDGGRRRGWCGWRER